MLEKKKSVSQNLIPDWIHGVSGENCTLKHSKNCRFWLLSASDVLTWPTLSNIIMSVIRHIIKLIICLSYAYNALNGLWKLQNTAAYSFLQLHQVIIIIFFNLQKSLPHKNNVQKLRKETVVLSDELILKLMHHHYASCADGC